MAQPNDIMPTVSDNSSQRHKLSPSTASLTTEASETASTTSTNASSPSSGRRRALTTTAKLNPSTSSPTLAPPPTYSTVLDMSVKLADSANATSPTSSSMPTLGPNPQMLNNRVSRAPSFLGRPTQSPLGPRTRFGPRAMSTGPNSMPEIPPLPSILSSASIASSSLLTTRDLPFPLPTHDPSPQYPGPATDSPAHTEITLPSIKAHDPPPPHSPPRTTAPTLPNFPAAPPPKSPTTPLLPSAPAPALASISVPAVPQSNITISPVIQPSTPVPSASPSMHGHPNSPKRVGTVKKKIPAKLAILTPPPKLSFEPVTVNFKSFPLEAFLWTLNDEELQKLVSRAIRATAREAFVRLLSLDNLERAIPEEIQRLEGLKARTQARYRFLVTRRTMLLQALNSSSSSGDSKINDDGVAAGSTFAKQLSEACADCDKAMETLAQTTDQLLQLNKMVDMHWASALAIALRKLNKSYRNRTEELITTRDKVTNLEAELKEAWDQATKYAGEIDDMERDTMFLSDDEFDVEEEEAEEEALLAAESANKTQDMSDLDSELDEAEVAVIEKAEVVTLPPSRRASTISDIVLKRSTRSSFPPMPPPLDILPEFTPMPHLSSTGKSPQSAPGVVSPVQSSFPSSPIASGSRPHSMPPHSPLPPVPPPKDPVCYAKHNRRASYAASIRSTRSTKSTKSVSRSIKSARQSRASALLTPGSRPTSHLASSSLNSAMTDSVSITGSSRLTLVSAARMRSHRASKGSLRIPRTPGSALMGHPPVPDLPLEFLAAASAMTTPSTSVWIDNASFAIAGEDSPVKDDVLSPGGKISRIRRTSLDVGHWIGLRRAKTLGGNRGAQESLLSSNEGVRKPSQTVDDIDFRPVFVGEIQKPKKPTRPVPDVPEQLTPTEIPAEWLSQGADAQQAGPSTANDDRILSFSGYFHKVTRSFDTEDVLDLDLNLSLRNKWAEEEADEDEDDHDVEEEADELPPESVTEESTTNAILATTSSPLSQFGAYSHSGYGQAPDPSVQKDVQEANVPGAIFTSRMTSLNKSLPPTPQARPPSTSPSPNFNPNVSDPRILSALSKLALGRNTSLRGRPSMKSRYSLHLPRFKPRASVVPSVIGVNFKAGKSEDPAGVTSESERSPASAAPPSSLKMSISKNTLSSVRSLPGRLGGGGSSSRS